MKKVLATVLVALLLAGSGVMSAWAQGGTGPTTGGTTGQTMTPAQQRARLRQLLEIYIKRFYQRMAADPKTANLSSKEMCAMCMLSLARMGFATGGITCENSTAAALAQQIADLQPVGSLLQLIAALERALGPQTGRVGGAVGAGGTGAGDDVTFDDFDFGKLTEPVLPPVDTR